MHHPPYLDASTRAAGGKQGGNEITHIADPSLPNKRFLCFTQIPAAACLSLFKYLRSLFSACRFVLWCLLTPKRQRSVCYSCVWASLMQHNSLFGPFPAPPFQNDTYFKCTICVICGNVKDRINANASWLAQQLIWKHIVWLSCLCSCSSFLIEMILVQELCPIYQSNCLKGSREAISANKFDSVLMGYGSSLMRMSVSGVSNWMWSELAVIQLRITHLLMQTMHWKAVIVALQMQIRRIQ